MSPHDSSNIPKPQSYEPNPMTGDLRIFNTDEEVPTTRPSGLSRFKRSDGPSVIQRHKIPDYDHVQSLVQKAIVLLGSLKKDGLTVAYDVMSVGMEALPLVPIPAVDPVGKVLLSIWEAVQLIEMNRVACVRLTERCANAIISIGEEVQEAGQDVISELSKPMMRLHEAFTGVHAFLKTQKEHRFIQRYLKRDDAQSAIRHCDLTVSDALFQFNTNIQIRALKIQLDLQRRAKDAEQCGSGSAMNQPPSKVIGNAFVLATTGELPPVADRQNGFRRNVFQNLLCAQDARDRKADREDLQKRLRSAMDTHDDGIILDILGIKFDEIPETITALKRILRVLNDFDREFMSAGFDALVRLSHGFDHSVPHWTITRDEVELVEEIGVGFFSTVYKGQCRGRTVAIKLLDAVSTTRKLFVKEICMHLRHPNVMKLLGASSATSNPPWLLISPYYRNGNLIRYLKGAQKDAPVDFSKMMLEIASGMKYLHGNNVLHGDLKASNILVDDDLCCVVADFGQSELKSEFSRVTAQEELRARGTMMWLAPEVLTGSNGNLTCEVDVYAFGILCAEILNRGSLPWGPLVTPAIVHRLVCVEDKRPALPAEYLDSSHAVSKLIRRAWARRSNDRPSFEAIKRELEFTRNTRRLASRQSLSSILEATSQELESPPGKRSPVYEQLHRFAPSHLEHPAPIPPHILDTLPPPFIDITRLPEGVIENLRSSIAQIPASSWHLLPANVQILTDRLEQRCRMEEDKQATRAAEGKASMDRRQEGLAMRDPLVNPHRRYQPTVEAAFVSNPEAIRNPEEYYYTVGWPTSDIPKRTMHPESNGARPIQRHRRGIWLSGYGH